jgi:predicted dehydrogenase
MDVAVIGTGANPEESGPDGYAMAYQHAEAYETIDDCELVACADIVPENAAAFAERFDVPDVYEDHETMLAEATPEFVSVTVPPAVHAPIAVDCARAPSVGGIHCEKPMAQTFGGARLMAQEAARTDTQLTFNHQRRYGPEFQEAEELLDTGEIGDLQRVETGPPNLYDWGTHCFDLCGMYVDEAQPEWVLCGLDYTTENVKFGAHNETDSVVAWEYETGVSGLASTSEGGNRRVVEPLIRLVGTEGTIEIHSGDDDLRVRRGDGWETPDVSDVDPLPLAIEAVVEDYRSGRLSPLRAENALNATEIIFGAWESSRRRGRVEFPLTIDDNPLEAMVESGDLTPE